jgi:internalin A
LGYNQITDISPLSGLKNLERLNLNYNEVKDISILKKLTNLTKLVLISNPFPQSQIDNLRRALPTCDIEF